MPDVGFILSELPAVILWALTLLVAAGLGYLFARRIASQAAVPVVNARLYERTDKVLEQRVDELATRNRQLDNAIQFSPEDAVVQVSVVWSEGQRMAECRVRDRDPGIPPEYRERIFVKFFQMPGPRRQRGTGLGLPFSRLAVEAHGGRIWVEDNPGGGSVFVFTLPATKDK